MKIGTTIIAAFGAGFIRRFAFAFAAPPTKSGFDAESRATRKPCWSRAGKPSASTHSGARPSGATRSSCTKRSQAEERRGRPGRVAENRPVRRAQSGCGRTAGLVEGELAAGKVNLDDPATTLALLKLNSVVGVKGTFTKRAP